MNRCEKYNYDECLKFCYLFLPFCRCVSWLNKIDYPACTNSEINHELSFHADSSKIRTSLDNLDPQNYFRFDRKRGKKFEMSFLLAIFIKANLVNFRFLMTVISKVSQRKNLSPKVRDAISFGSKELRFLFDFFSGSVSKGNKSSSDFCRDFFVHQGSLEYSQIKKYSHAYSR